MQYLLDTNIWIHYLRDPDSPVRGHLSSHQPDDIVTCSVVRAELLHGAEKYGNRLKRISLVEKTLAPYSCLPFDEHDAEQYAEIRHNLEITGQVIGPYDLLIAAICVRHRLTLVTQNLGEFGRVAGLQLENWMS